MKFGVCCNSDRFDRVSQLGYDYVECGFSTLVSLTDEQMAQFVEKLKNHSLKLEACHGFFGPEVVIVGPDADIAFLPDYVEKGMSRVADLGCEVVVLGSGKARNIPEGFDKETAEKQFMEVLQIVGNIAQKYGVKIAIEPLNSGETNLINTVGECIDIVKKLNHPNVGALADFFHVYKSGESLEAIENAGELLFHTHLARAKDDRRQPTELDDLEVCKKWAQALKKCGYKGRMSLEGSFLPDFNETVEKVLPALNIFQEIVG